MSHIKTDSGNVGLCLGKQSKTLINNGWVGGRARAMMKGGYLQWMGGGEDRGHFCTITERRQTLSNFRIWLGNALNQIRALSGDM